MPTYDCVWWAEDYNKYDFQNIFKDNKDVYNKIVNIMHGENKDPWNGRLLILSCRYGNIKLTKLLLNHNYGKINKSRNAAFVFACAWGYYDIVKLLLKHKDFDHKTMTVCAFIEASSNNDIKIVKLLIDDDRILKEHTIDDFLPKLAFNSFDCFKMILENYKPTNRRVINDLMFEVCRNGHTKILEVLLKNKEFDPSYDNNYYMFNAISRGYNDMVKLLLKDERVDPVTCHYQPHAENHSVYIPKNYVISIAYNRKNWEMVKILLNDNRISKYSQYLQKYIIYSYKLIKEYNTSHNIITIIFLLMMDTNDILWPIIQSGDVPHVFWCKE